MFPYIAFFLGRKLCQVVYCFLVHDVLELHHGHLTTGNLCTKYILEALTDNGHADVAYQIATQETYPSWGYMLAHGATTVWERWDSDTAGPGMNSEGLLILGTAKGFSEILAFLKRLMMFWGFCLIM